MHIEINAGGLGGGIAVAEYQWNMAGFISDEESVLSSFQAVRSKVGELIGGVGSLQNAVDALSARIRREEEIKEAAVEVRKKSNGFLDLAIRVDKQVAALVDQNRDALYHTDSWLRPAVSVDDAPWYEDAWDWLCGKGEQIAEGARNALNWIGDTAKKAWNGIVAFYTEHKKIIDTVLIVVGAIGAIAAVVFTGGAALVPLLGALGMSATAAAAVSTAVAVVAVVSTVASSALNVADIWAEIDDPSFNAWQKGLNIVSAVSNLTYSIGNLYNSIKGINPQDYLAAQKSNGTMFDDTIPIAQDKFSSERYFAKGDHYDEFADFWENSGDGYSYIQSDQPQTQYVRAKEIEGVFLNQSEVDDPLVFWNKRYTKSDYADYVTSGGFNQNPVEVTKVNDAFYYFSGEGRHRILAAQELDIEIPVIIKGFYTK